MRFTRTILLQIPMALCQAVIGLAGNLVFNGDFESASDASPPPGWAMWGDDCYKTAANYTRDLSNPHSGLACYRIHHPAGTDGYTVVSPQHAIRAEKGTSYALTFWARSDSPGESLVGIGAYESVDPFVDAPPPGFWPVEVGTDWKPYRFVVHEGLDFFSETSQLMMPVFRATTKKERPRTLWIDDVEMTATPRPKDLPALIGPDALRVQPIEHGVTPGGRFTVRADAANPVGESNRMATGISFHRVRGHPNHPFTKQGDGPSRYNLAPATEQGIIDLRVPWTRFYALGDEPLGAEWSLDRVAEICRRLKIPMERVVLELEVESAGKRLTPETWANAVRHSVEQGYGFRYWEIGNEVFASMVNGGKGFKNADDYIDHLVAVSRAIKAVQPEARIGASIANNLKWGDYVMARAAGSYDFVVPHLYAFGDAYRKPFEFIVLEENRLALEQARRLRAMVKAYNPDRAVEILDTEWGLHSSSREGGAADYANRNANVIGMMHRAVRMIYYAKGGFLDGASTWGMFGQQEQPGFCVLPVDQPDRRTMLFWLYHHFSRHLGERVLPVSGTAGFYTDPETKQTMPLTPLLVTRSVDGPIYAIIANGSWEEPAPLRLSIAGATILKASAVALTQDDRDASAILPDAIDPVREVNVAIEGDTLVLTIPPHSLVFVTIETK